MQRLFGIVFLIVGAGTAWAQADGGDAYGALRAAQTVAPGATLVSITGERGEPHPSEWTVLYSDPKARGGIREVVVSGDVIVSQRTPLEGYSGMAGQAPIKLAQLNLNSDAAFNVADKQAKKRSLGFNWVDYSLRTDDNGSPVWVLRLFDNMGAQVGSIKVSAADGSILTPLQDTASTRTDEETPRASSSAPHKKMGGLIGTVSNTVENTANKVKNTTLRTVGNVQEFLTGDRTVGPKD